MPIRRAVPRQAARRGLPRLRPSPEHGIIQNPALIRVLQQITGTRQAHLNPALADGVQPVVVLADYQSQQSGLNVPVRYATWVQGDISAGNPLAVLINPANTGVVVQLHRISVSAPIVSGILNFAIFNDDAVSVPLIQQRRGIKLAAGSIGGDSAAASPASKALLRGSSLIPIISTIYEQQISINQLAAGPTAPNPHPFERDFDALFLGPFSSFEMWIEDSTSGIVQFYAEWSEKPLS